MFKATKHIQKNTKHEKAGPEEFFVTPSLKHAKSLSVYFLSLFFIL
jgi:hypothetical protein